MRHGQSQLRRLAEARGYRVTGSQFQDFVRAGLLPPPDEHKRWDEGALNMLLQVRALGDRIKFLPRRVVYLYPEPGFFIEEETLWRAMQNVAPNILDGDAKMRRLHTALLPMTAAAGRLPLDWAPPGAETWRGLIRLYMLADVRARILQWYHWASDLEKNLPDISPEERVLLVALDELAMQFTYALRHADVWVTDSVPMRTPDETDAKYREWTAPRNEGETAKAAPPRVAAEGKPKPKAAAPPALHTRAEWAFSEAVAQPAPSDAAAEPETARATTTRRTRAAG